MFVRFDLLFVLTRGTRLIRRMSVPDGHAVGKPCVVVCTCIKKRRVGRRDSTRVSVAVRARAARRDDRGTGTRPHVRPATQRAPRCAARFETQIFIDSTLVDAQIAARSIRSRAARPPGPRRKIRHSLVARIRHQKPAVAWASGQTRPGPFHLCTAKNSGRPKRSGVVCLTSHAHHSAADRCDFSYAAVSFFAAAGAPVATVAARVGLG